MKDSFILYASQMSALSDVLTDEQLGRLMRLILSYINGEEVSPPEDLRIAWAFMKHQIDIDREKYSSICERRKEYGKMGGLAKATKSYQELPKAGISCHNDNDNDKDNDIKEKSKPKKNAGAFIKPSLDEIKAYCLERRNNVNAEQFFAFYESNGWKVGKNSMKSWKAAIVTWESRTGSTNNVNDLRDAY